MREIFHLRGIPKVVIFDRDLKFTSSFWKVLFTRLAAQVYFSTTYHPQMDEKTKQGNQLLEYMLRMYVMPQPTKWEDYLHLVEFTYNNSYRASLSMSLFKVLYG